MHRKSLLLMLALAGFSGGFMAACFDDDTPGGTRDRPFGEDAGTDGGEEVTVVNPPFCPESDPKVGDACPRQAEGDARCSYVQRQCTYNGNVYDIRIEYCCFQGSWSQCGTNQTPCDNLSEQDAAEEGDGGATDGATGG